MVERKGAQTPIITTADALPTFIKQQLILPGKSSPFLIGVDGVRLPFDLASIRAKSPLSSSQP
jgi:hypothetical protein